MSAFYVFAAIVSVGAILVGVYLAFARWQNRRHDQDHNDIWEP